MAFPVNLATAAAEELAALLRDTRDNVNSGNPDWVANGTPESAIGKLNQAAARQHCRRWARGNPSSYQRMSDANYEKLCTPYLDSIGENPGLPTATPSVIGGQCEGTQYELVVSAVFEWFAPCSFDAEFGQSGTDTPSRTLGAGSTDLYGPLSVTPTTGRFSETFGCRTQFGQNYQLSYRDAAGNPQTLGFNLVCGRTGRDIQSQSFSAVATAVSGPDDCGDSPNKDIEPPPPVTTPLPPVVVTVAPNFEVTLDTDIDVDGRINITFEPGSDEPVTVPVSPPGEGGPTSASPGESEDTGTGGSDPTSGEAEGEAPDGEYLVGVTVEVIQVPPSANISFAGAALYRGAAYVYLGIEDNLDLQPEGAILRSGQFFFAPEGSSHWRVVAGLGYNLRITPYYAAKAGRE